MVAVIVILVHGHDDGGGVHDGLAGVQRLPDEPVIPKDAENKRRQVRPEEAPSKDEVVDPFGGAATATAEGQVAEAGFQDSRFPIVSSSTGDSAGRSGKRERNGDVGVPAPADHKE